MNYMVNKTVGRLGKKEKQRKDHSNSSFMSPYSTSQLETRILNATLISKVMNSKFGRYGRSSASFLFEEQSARTEPKTREYVLNKKQVDIDSRNRGGEYASFMKEIVKKAKSRNVVLPVLQITAIVPEEFAIESRLIRENLCQFVQNLKIRFHIDLVPLRTFQMLSFKLVKLMEGEKLAIILRRRFN